MRTQWPLLNDSMRAVEVRGFGISVPTATQEVGVGQLIALRTAFETRGLTATLQPSPCAGVLEHPVSATVDANIATADQRDRRCLTVEPYT